MDIQPGDIFEKVLTKERITVEKFEYLKGKVSIFYTFKTHLGTNFREVRPLKEVLKMLEKYKLIGNYLLSKYEHHKGYDIEIYSELVFNADISIDGSIVFRVGRGEDSEEAQRRAIKEIDLFCVERR